MVNANCQITDCAGNNKLAVSYKIDIGGDSNIMPWYIFKKLFPRVTESELEKAIKKHIKLKKNI